MSTKLYLPVMTLLLASLLVFALIGCGGGSKSAGIGAPDGRGSLEIRVAWPDTGTRVIPESAVRIKVTVVGTGLTAAREAEISRPASSVRIDDLPVGRKSVLVAAYDASDMKVADGIASNISIVNDKTTDVTITLTELTDVDALIEKAIELLMQAKDSDSPSAIEGLSVSALGYLETAVNAAAPDSRSADKANFYWVLAKLGSTGASIAADWGVSSLGGGGGGATLVRSTIGSVLAVDPVEAVRIAGKATSLSGAVGMFNSKTVSDIVVPTQRMTSESRSMPDTDTGKYNKAVADISGKLLPAFEESDTHLQALCREDLDLVLMNPIDPGNPDAVLVLDYGDINALRASFQMVIGLLHSSLAYNLDPGSAGYRDLAACDANHDGRVTPSEYLPTPTYGTLTSSGRTSLANTKQSFLSALESLRLGAVYHLEPGVLSRDYELLKGADPKDIAAVRDLATYLKRPFSGPFTMSPWMTGLGQDTLVNLSATFDDPITDIRAVAPTFVATDGGYKADLSTGTDRTIGGLFPNGLPNELLYSVWDPTRLFGDLTVIVN